MNPGKSASIHDLDLTENYHISAHSRKHVQVDLLQAFISIACSALPDLRTLLVLLRKEVCILTSGS